MSAIIAAFAVTADGAEPQQRAQLLPEVQVIDTVPLPGVGVPLVQIPANVQHVGGEQLSRQNVFTAPGQSIRLFGCKCPFRTVPNGVGAALDMVWFELSF